MTATYLIRWMSWELSQSHFGEHCSQQETWGWDGLKVVVDHWQRRENTRCKNKRENTQEKQRKQKTKRKKKQKMQEFEPTAENAARRRRRVSEEGHEASTLLRLGLRGLLLLVVNPLRRTGIAEFFGQVFSQLPSDHLKCKLGLGWNKKFVHQSVWVETYHMKCYSTYSNRRAVKIKTNLDICEASNRTVGPSKREFHHVIHKRVPIEASCWHY